MKAPPKYSPVGKAEKKDIDLTYADLLAWHNGDLQAMGVTLRSRKNAYARNSKAKGRKNLDALARELNLAFGALAFENYKRKRRADRLRAWGVKRLRQALALDANPVIASLLPLIEKGLARDDDMKPVTAVEAATQLRKGFDFGVFFEALENANESPEPEFWFNYAVEAAKARMDDAYAMGEYGRMNRIGESLAKMEAAMHAVSECL